MTRAKPTDLKAPWHHRDNPTKVCTEENRKFTHLITGVRTPTGFKHYRDHIGKRAKYDGNAYGGFWFEVEGFCIWHRPDTVHFTYIKLENLPRLEDLPT